MEVIVVVQSGTFIRTLRVQLKRRVSARRGGDYNEVEVPQAIQKKSHPSRSNCAHLRVSFCLNKALASGDLVA
jgi:hypothetical protein